jgi:large subunit ribosomal protein L17
MRHRLGGRHLGRETSHRLALYRNLVTDLVRYERITTTEAKATEIRPMAEKIITLGRGGDLHARRQANKFVYDPRVVKKVFDDIGPRMATRPGGYLRITGLEPRKGDGARMSVIELVDFVDAPATPRPARVTASPTVAGAGQGGAAAPVLEANIDEQPRGESFENRAVDRRPLAEEPEPVAEAEESEEPTVADVAETEIESAIEPEPAAEAAADEPAEGDDQAPA